MAVTTVAWSPGHGNVFIPGFGVNGVNQRSTGRIQIEFSRAPERFSLNRYIQLVPDSPESGFYLLLDTAEAVRLVNDQDYVWPDGTDAPDIGDRPLTWKSFTTIRRAFPFRLGRKAVDNAQFDVVAAHARMAATQAMTRRTNEALTTLTEIAAWGANTEANTNDLVGSASPWNAATGDNILASVQAMVERILLSTGGAVTARDMILLISVKLAHVMRGTPEIIQYLVNHERAISAGMMQSEITSNYGLPTELYGVGLVVEDAVKVTKRRSAMENAAGATAQGVADAGSFILGDDDAIMVSRPGGLTGGITGGPTFSTLTGFVYEDMVIENFDDPENRRVKGRVVDDIDIKLTAPMAGFFLQDALT